MRDDAHGGAVPDGGGFGEQLARIKSEGGNLLVTGVVPADLHARACRKLSGQSDASKRRVIVLVGNGIDAVESYLPEGASRDPGHLVVVDTGCSTRSAAATAQADSSPITPEDELAVRQLESCDTGVLVDASVQALEDLVVASDPDEDGPRVCVDDLSALLAERDSGEVLEFCHSFTRRIIDAGGQGVFHLPLSADSEEAASLTPVFDVVVDLRVSNGRLEQRWHTRDGGDSGWIPL